jgi:hypothetical protein
VDKPNNQHSAAFERIVMKKMLLLTMILLSESVFADTTAKITDVGLYGNGDVFVILDTTITQVGCSAPRFDVPKVYAITQDILSIARTALQNQKFVDVRTNGCYQNNPTLDGSRNTYFKVRSTP